MSTESNQKLTAKEVEERNSDLVKIYFERKNPDQMWCKQCNKNYACRINTGLTNLVNHHIFTIHKQSWQMELQQYRFGGPCKQMTISQSSLSQSSVSGTLADISSTVVHDDDETSSKLHLTKSAVDEDNTVKFNPPLCLEELRQKIGKIYKR